MNRRAVLAFSGGLDTSYCVLYLKQELGMEVTSVTFDCGGWTDEDRRRITDRALQCGVVEHKWVDLRPELCERILKPLIRSGYRKGGNYPFCVGAERGLQAQGLAEAALRGGFDAVCHGSTGAGNDQVRFDVTLRAMLPENVEILTPIRSLSLSREETTRRLESAGIPVEAKTTLYSINSSLWGTTIGGGPLHDPSQPIPRDVRYRVLDPHDVTAADEEATIGFESGVPVSLNGEALNMVELLERLDRLGEAHGIGRDVHTGDTALGIKGRIIFEAPAATIIHLAHRELMKIVLSKHQLAHRDSVVALWGTLLHDGLWLDPVLRDIEAYLESEQQQVTGEVTVRLGKGTLELVSLDSVHSRMKGRARYGETTAGWDGRDAEGFTKIQSLTFGRRA